MTEFNFDAGKKYTENCSDFLESARSIDPEMAEILEANWEKLLDVVRGGERNPRSRTAFNEAIAVALDELLARNSAEEEE